MALIRFMMCLVRIDQLAAFGGSPYRHQLENKGLRLVCQLFEASGW